MLRFAVNISHLFHDFFCIIVLHIISYTKNYYSYIERVFQTWEMAQIFCRYTLKDCFRGGGILKQGRKKNYLCNNKEALGINSVYYVLHPDWVSTSID